MQQVEFDTSDSPVLILAPTGNDARNAADVLTKARFRAEFCTDMEELCRRANEQTGAFFITEESLHESALKCLSEFLDDQPPWSDLPIVLLTIPGEIKRRTYHILNVLGARANVTLVEKPLRALTLVSVIRVSLRSRGRQFEVRDLLQGYAEKATEAQRASAKFKALFDQSSAFAGILALDGKVMEANRASLEICGFQPEEIVGRNFWECGWWHGLDAVQSKIQAGIRHAAAGLVYKAVLPYVWADGSQHVVDFAIHPIRDGNGKTIFLHPTGVDITERQEALARMEFLGQLTQKLSTVSDPSEINRTATQEIGRFLRVDRCYFFQAASRADEIKILADWHQADRRSIEGVYKTASFGSEEWWKEFARGPIAIDDVQTHPWTKDSLNAYAAMNCRACAAVSFLQEGRWVAGIFCACEKVRHWTAEEKSLLENVLARVWPLIERAHAERSLREANSLLADKAAHLETLVQQRTVKLRDTIGDLEAFSYSIAHDMRAPLRSLQSFSEILLDEHGANLNPDGQHLLQRIANAAGRMDKLIQDVLNYSRIMRSDFTLERVNVEKLLRDIISTYPSFAAESVDIVIEGQFPPLFGNEAMMTQIFSNLMGNAVKFVAPGQKPHIRIWAREVDGRVRIFVQDKGIGISPSQHERIFGIFQQVNKDFAGTGIGLAITKKAAERMGATIGLESELGKGSTFWVDAQRAESVTQPE